MPKVPDAVGVPQSCPSELSVSPGISPETVDHVYGGKPRSAKRNTMSLVQYPSPTVPLGSVVCRIFTSCRGVTTNSASVLDAMSDNSSVTDAVSEYSPATRGVPVSRPLGLNIIPSGSTESVAQT